MKKLAPQLIDLTRDACLKAFWRKKSLRIFLRQHSISEKHLATWSNEDSKRDYLERLIYDLINQKDNFGHQSILEIAQSLAKMTCFPDLENWEDSQEKIEAAKIAIARLKVEVDKITQHAKDEDQQHERRRRAEKVRLEAVQNQQTVQDLIQRLSELVSQQGTAAAGRAFENWFYDLVNFFEIESRPPYNSDGRQIDGALTLDGTTYLVETKFTEGKTGSPDIDVFMSKVTSKADNTMGVFVSMGGYTSGAIKGASKEKTPLLLFDFTHIYNLILANVLTLPDTIRRVKRHASQTGEAYLSVKKFSG